MTVRLALNGSMTQNMRTANTRPKAGNDRMVRIAGLKTRFREPDERVSAMSRNRGDRDRMKTWMISDEVMTGLEKYLGNAWSGNPGRRRLLELVLEDRTEIIEPDLDNCGQLDDCRVWITRADADEFNIPARGEVDGVSD